MFIPSQGLKKTFSKKHEPEIAAFTLIELMAIIIVISVLGIITFSTGCKKVELSQSEVCKMRLKSICMSIQMYATDNEDYLPWPNYDNPDGVPGWLYKFDSNLKGEERFLLKEGQLWKYLNAQSIYKCPGEITNVFTYQRRVQKLSSFTMNGNLKKREVGKTHKITEYNPECYLITEPDERIPFNFNDGSSLNHDPLSIRHESGSFIGKMDGSIEHLTEQDRMTKEHRNRFNCRPRSK